MESKDLRIGNYVIVKSLLTYVNCTRIVEVDAGFISDVDSNELYHSFFQECHPIPLTEEWLVNFGFIVGESNCDREAKIYSIQVSNTDLLYFDDGEWYISHQWDNNHFKNTFWNQPKYVHQLQNLYYSLSGEDFDYEIDL